MKSKTNTSIKNLHSGSRYLRLLLSFLFLVGMQGTSVHAETTTEAVQNLLEGRHWTLDAEAFQKMQGAETVLMQIADDTNTINYKRFRALTALRVYYRKENVAVFLEGYVKKNEAQAPLARRAFNSFATGFSRTHAPQIQQLAEGLLQHKDGTLRIVAARALKTSNPAAFERFIKSENQAWVKQAAQE